MIRYSIFLLATVAVTAFSLTALAPAQAVAENPKNVTVIYQTVFARGSHPVLFERCGKEDCSDTTEQTTVSTTFPLSTS